MPIPEGHLLLVGFMGSGKSTIGPLLACRTGLPYRELDERIRERYQLSIPHIFQRYGEPAFRNAETWELERLLLDPPAVIALGGGAFRAANRRLLSQTTRTIWLNVTLDEAWRRCGKDPHRPLAADFGEFRKLFEHRQKDYRTALHRVCVDNQDPGVIVQAIVDWLVAQRE